MKMNAKFAMMDLFLKMESAKHLTAKFIETTINNAVLVLMVFT